MKARAKASGGNIAIAKIRRDGGTQIRVALDEDTVQEYTDLIKAGVKFPPVGVYQDGALDQDTPSWLWDGFHRVEAYSRAGIDRIEAEFRAGTRRDAIRAACGANADHGLKRSNADKRRAVETFLADPEWCQWSDGAIAQDANVSRQMVSNVRSELATLPVELHRVIGLDGRERTRPANDSASGQPTPGHSPSGNPAEGETGAGVPVAPASAGTESAAPAPDESRDRLVNVERMLRDAQAELAPLVAKGAALAVLVALNDALAVVRKALAPTGDFEVSVGVDADEPIPFSVAPVQGAGWPEPKTKPVPAKQANGFPSMPTEVNGRKLRPGWAPCVGGNNDVGHVPSLRAEAAECSRCKRALFVVEGARDLVIERDEDATPG